MNKVVRAVISLQKNLFRKISPEKLLDFWSQKSVLRPALATLQNAATHRFIRIEKSFEVGLTQENLWVTKLALNLMKRMV